MRSGFGTLLEARAAPARTRARHSAFRAATAALRAQQQLKSSALAARS